ncbi:helix-turn-helix domain-containing protein [Cohaesibacter celericrescens]|uniref:XRE family transcriptional regulator n=1 Tax=Cohaesibacter celericrescens TaxID=2067669 RepID=A0A2N5XQL3_9HYPH|nr:XRE family transcriptional regulator [Cohaesibacter celericrescens]PLW76727.1 XRE family transcriptional regulator [Cohaesibacter celericrescens]
MRLTELRRDRQWSLEQLSAKSGVSRASLSRLENAEVAATAEMLGKICSAYEMPLSRLIMMTEEAFKPKISMKDQLVWSDQTQGFSRRLVSPPSSQLSGEILECTLSAGAEIQYDAAPVHGLEHQLLILSGSLAITVDDTQYDLSQGDCLRYVLRGPSRFCADSVTGANYLLVLIS